MTIDHSGPPIQRWLSESPNEVPWNDVSSVLNQQPANSSGQAAESLVKRLLGGTDSIESANAMDFLRLLIQFVRASRFQTHS
jgi:hypothetical protein